MKQHANMVGTKSIKKLDALARATTYMAKEKTWRVMRAFFQCHSLETAYWFGSFRIAALMQTLNIFTKESITNIVSWLDLKYRRTVNCRPSSLYSSTISVATHCRNLPNKNAFNLDIGPILIWWCLYVFFRWQQLLSENWQWSCFRDLHKYKWTISLHL